MLVLTVKQKLRLSFTICRKRTWICNNKSLIRIYCLFIRIRGCQGGAVGRGLDCQSWGWQFESQLGQINKKNIRQVCNLKIAGSFGSRPKLEGRMYHNKIVGMLKIHHYSSHIGQVLRLPGVVSSDVLLFAFVRITLTVPEVVGIKNWVTSNLPFLLDPRIIAKMQS